jgi:hypothetical protein
MSKPASHYYTRNKNGGLPEVNRHRWKSMLTDKPIPILQPVSYGLGDDFRLPLLKPTEPAEAGKSRAQEHEAAGLWRLSERIVGCLEPTSRQNIKSFVNMN